MPRVNGAEVLSLNRDEVWRLLNDPDTLAASIPGCRGFERDVAGEHRYRTAIKVAVGAVTGVYEGTVEYTDIAEPEQCTIVVAGKGDKGAIDGRGAITLAPSGSGTEVRYEGEFKLTGPIAGVGQRMAPGISRKMIVETLRNLERHADAEQAITSTERAAEPAPSNEGAAAAAMSDEGAGVPDDDPTAASSQSAPGAQAHPTAAIRRRAPATDAFRPFTISPVVAFVAGLVIGVALGVAAGAAWL